MLITRIHNTEEILFPPHDFSRRRRSRADRRPTDWACRHMYRSLWRAVVWAFSSWPRGSVDFPASSSSSHKAVFVDSEVNKGRLKLNTGSSKGETVKILREGADLSREGYLKSTRRHHTSTCLRVKRLFGLFQADSLLGLPALLCCRLFLLCFRRSLIIPSQSDANPLWNPTYALCLLYRDRCRLQPSKLLFKTLSGFRVAVPFDRRYL